MTYGKRLLVVFSVLAGIYIFLNLALPIDPTLLSRYRVSAGHLRFLTMMVTLPLVAIWYIAFYGFLRTYEYARSIRAGRDGRAFMEIARGLKWLAFTFPAGAIVRQILNYLAQRNTDLQPTATISRNYLGVVFALIAFILISRGAIELGRIAQKRFSTTEQHYGTLGVIVFSVLYTFLVIERPQATNQLQRAYFLPTWLILATLVIPYLYAWYRGLIAAYYIYFYGHRVSGQLYRRGLIYFGAGLAAVILFSIVSQLILTVSASLNKMELTPILITIYVLLFLSASGYVAIAIGARKLKRIEEV
jgi:hypothetical protein